MVDIRWFGDARAVRLMAGVAGLTAGLAWAASELLRPIFPTVDDVACNTGASYAVNALDLIKFAAVGLAVLMLGRLVSARSSGVVRRIAIVGASTSVATGIANGVEHCADLEALGIVYGLGLLLSMLSLVGFGILVARTDDPSSWIGRIVAVGTLALWFGFQQGWGRVVAAVTWTAVGVGLLSKRFKKYGCDHPPWAKPPAVSSSGPPGA